MAASRIPGRSWSYTAPTSSPYTIERPQIIVCDSSLRHGPYLDSTHPIIRTDTLHLKRQRWVMVHRQWRPCSCLSHKPVSQPFPHLPVPTLAQCSSNGEFGRARRICTAASQPPRRAATCRSAASRMDTCFWGAQSGGRRVTTSTKQKHDVSSSSYASMSASAAADVAVSSNLLLVSSRLPAFHTASPSSSPSLAAAAANMLLDIPPL